MATNPPPLSAASEADSDERSETEEDEEDEEDKEDKEETRSVEHPGGGWKVFGDAINAYERLMKVSANVGAVTQLDGVGSRVAPKEYPGAAKGKRFELNYDKPDGALVITRSFLPVEASKISEYAKAHVEQPRVGSKEYRQVYPKHVKEMELLMTTLRTSYLFTVKSAVTRALMDKIAELHFFYSAQNRMCTTPTEVFKAYNSQEPDLVFIGKIYELYYGWWDEKKDQVTYDCMRKMNLWLASDKAPQKNAKRVSCLSSLVGLVIRQIRNVFSRDDRISHGIRLTISVKAGREKNNMPRRKKEDGFIPALMVLGWGEDKHEAFNDTINAPKPVPLEQAIIAYEAEKIKKATLPHGSVRFSCSVFMTCCPSAK